MSARSIFAKVNGPFSFFALSVAGAIIACGSDPSQFGTEEDPEPVVDASKSVDAAIEAQAEAPIVDASPDAPPATPKIPFPAYNADFADPFVLQDGTSYYGYATNVFEGGVKLHIPVIQSNDLATWSKPIDSLPKVGAWGEDGYLTWAPTVHKVSAGRYVMFYANKQAGSSPVGQLGKQCIGRAVGPSPTGPFVDNFGGPLICDGGGLWAIDPSVYTASNGKRYLLWRQDVNGSPTAVNHAAIRELAADGANFAAGSTTRLLIGRDQEWEKPVLENPVMVELGGKLFLFYSANDWETANYGVGYAECASPLGPCTKKTAAGPWFKSIFAIAGPGGEEFFKRGDELMMAYHTWVVPNVGPSKGKRVLAISRVALNAGVPELQDPNKAP